MARRVAAFTLVVPDYDAALDFFAGKLGFALIEDADLGAGKRWVLIAPDAASETRILLARAEGPAQSAAIGNQTGGRVGFFLETDDFARDHARLIAAGVEFEETPRRESYGIVAVWRDPFGNRWDLIEFAGSKPTPVLPPPMFSYACLGTDDLDQARKFYDATLAPLGHFRLPEWDDATSSMWGLDDPGPHLWVTLPFDGGPARPGNGTMLSFLAGTRKAVDAFHAAALASGGTNSGAPGLRPQYGPTFYAGYIRDPDGNKINAVCYEPD